MLYITYLITYVNILVIREEMLSVRFTYVSNELFPTLKEKTHFYGNFVNICLQKNISGIMNEGTNHLTVLVLLSWITLLPSVQCPRVIPDLFILGVYTLLLEFLNALR